MKKNLSEKKFETTLDEPKSNMAIGFQNKFDKTMTKNQVQLEEVDMLLNEKEQSLKKKIFNLAKMESLVHADPKLSTVYSEMADNGEEKYGYHYNETIMNMLFNDYVLNSSKYLQKYKMAIPKEKKRRDKSGINQLKKSGKKKQDATGTNIIEPEKVDEGMSLFKEEEKMAENPNNLETTKTEAQRISKEDGVAQHVNLKSNDNYVVSDWFDSDSTVASYENGMLKENKEIEETTGAASSGAYVGPAVWGSGDLMKGGKKQKKDKKSFWDGGVMVQESKNYLIEPDGFEKYFNRLNEEVIREEIITDLKTLGRKVTKEDIPNLAGQALYDVAIALANKYLPLSWNDFPDINSMWDYIDENGGMSFEDLKVGVKEACDERLAEDGFPEDLMEHHATTRDEKIDTILQILNSQDDGTIVGEEAFENMSDVALDQTYQDVEAMSGIAEQQLKEENYDDPTQQNQGNLDRNKIVGFDRIMSELDLTGQVKSETIEKVLTDNNINWNDLIILIKNAQQQLNPILNEKAKSKKQQRFMGMVHALQKGELDASEVGDKVEKAAASMTDKEAEDFASTKHKGLPNKVDEELDDTDNHIVQYDSDRAGEVPFEKGGIKWEFVNAIYPDGKKDIGVYRFGHDMVYDYDWFNNNINENSMTMIDQQEDSMAMKPPIDASQGGVETGMNSAMGGMNEEEHEDDFDENYIDEMDESLKKINNDLALFEMHQNKLKTMSEEKRHGALVLKDRLGKENEKNFKSDLKHSGTKEIIDTTKELEWKDQQTDVPSDPQKLGKDIEKEVLKNTKGEAFKDEGNSANNEGDEIPKRNLTDDETDEVDLYRKGLGDFVYDNKPDERFEERMERDMGEKNYKLRQKRMKFNADAPMYNKDTQPIEDGVEKVQFDKAKSEWNERMGIKENAMSGKYVDELGKTRIFDFSTLNVQEVRNSKKGAFFSLDVTGLGNTYDNRVQVNESIAKAINEWAFYTDGKNVFVEKKSVQILTETAHKKEKRSVNEQFNKMKHLLGYNPKDFNNTKNIKL